jgi:HK97 family phage prohead protease
MNPFEIIQRTIEVDDFTIRRASGDAERVLEARALRYGVPYEVTDNGGRSFYHEVWRAGVFARSIAQRGGRIPLHWHHQTGTMPYGAVFEVDDSPTDLIFRARIVNGERGDEMVELVEMGAVNGVSVGANIVRDRKFGGGVERLEAALKEVSLTSHAQIADGEILAMRAVIEDEQVGSHTHSITTPPPPPDVSGDQDSGTPVLDEALEFINSLERP